MRLVCALLISFLLIATTLAAAPIPAAPLPGDQLLADYFRDQTAGISSRCLAEIKIAEDWNEHKEEYRRQLAEMLGIWPMPPRTDLKPVVTGKTDSDSFSVERLYFQSMPGLYVTGDLYIPHGLKEPAPAILYVCGHARVVKDGVALGNKTAYQHHGEWFARNGYVCLIIDSLELGEIEGIHHGTYNLGMWWWHSRGYTPAGVETWNGIRALDYLTSRPEVDADRIGMTGRSGGGAYTWYVAAIDGRVKVACPVAGITDLQNHIVDGTIEGHCDCMFMDNTYRWDFPQVAALVAPRPMLICNSDKDTIFPLDGVYRLHEKVRNIYKLLGADKNLGLLITEGPHADTQELQVPVFRWFNRFLKGDKGTVDQVAIPMFEPQRLKVFQSLPQDQLNTRIQELFVAKAPPPRVPGTAREWAAQRDAWMTALKEKTFRGWPDSPPAMEVKPAFTRTSGGITFRAFDFVSQNHVPLRLFIAQPAEGSAKRVVLHVLDAQQWPRWLASMRAGFAAELQDQNPPPADQAGFDNLLRDIRKSASAFAWLAPRGVGPTAWSGDAKKQTQILRRFALLGQTLDGMRVWDVRRAMQAIRVVDDFSHAPLELSGQGQMAAIALYASLFEPNIARLDLIDLPRSHQDGPQLLNVLKTLDIPAAVAMAAEQSQVHLTQKEQGGWEYPIAVGQKLGWAAERFHVTASR
jgi:hypothetical protein